MLISFTSKLFNEGIAQIAIGTYLNRITYFNLAIPPVKCSADYLLPFSCCATLVPEEHTGKTA